MYFTSFCQNFSPGNVWLSAALGETACCTIFYEAGESESVKFEWSCNLLNEIEKVLASLIGNVVLLLMPFEVPVFIQWHLQTESLQLE